MGRWGEGRVCASRAWYKELSFSAAPTPAPLFESVSIFCPCCCQRLTHMNTSTHAQRLTHTFPKHATYTRARAINPTRCSSKVVCSNKSPKLPRETCEERIRRDLVHTSPNSSTFWPWRRHLYRYRSKLRFPSPLLQTSSCFRRASLHKSPNPTLRGFTKQKQQ